VHKRDFLAASVLGAATLPSRVGAGACDAGAASPALLTISGGIGKGNRGRLDAALDQFMVRQKIIFAKAHTFDFATLAALPAVTIRPTLEYDGKRHALRGPTLVDVLAAAGAAPADRARLLLKAVDGYGPTVTMGEVRKYGFIVATHLDERPMPLGGLGPLWAVFEPDRFADMAAKKLGDRFASCPWGLFFIEVPLA
jgi:hypothetical protein